MAHVERSGTSGGHVCHRKEIIMNAKNIPTTSPFATKNTNAKHVSALIAAALAQANESGEFPSTLWNNPEFGNIGESRGWLIARRAWLEVNQPKALVAVPAGTDFSKSPADAGASLRKFGKTLHNLRGDGHGDSWGELMVRTGLSEGKVRKAWSSSGDHEDRGHRTGKGGRFMADNPEIYLEHRKAEGGFVPVGLEKRNSEIVVEDLLNAKNADGKIVKFQRPAKRSAKKAS